MGKLAGVLVLMAGVIFPMVMVGWLAVRMNKRPSIPPNEMGLLLMFNGVLPVGLVLVGFGLMSPAFGAQPWVRIASAVSLAAAVVVLVALGVSRGRRTG